MSYLAAVVSQLEKKDLKMLWGGNTPLCEGTLDSEINKDKVKALLESRPKGLFKVADPKGHYKLTLALWTASDADAVDKLERVYVVHGTSRAFEEHLTESLDCLLERMAKLAKDSSVRLRED